MKLFPVILLAPLAANAASVEEKYFTDCARVCINRELQFPDCAFPDIGGLNAELAKCRADLSAAESCAAPQPAAAETPATPVEPSPASAPAAPPAITTNAVCKLNRSTQLPDNRPAWEATSYADFKQRFDATPPGGRCWCERNGDLYMTLRFYFTNGQTDNEPDCQDKCMRENCVVSLCLDDPIRTTKQVNGRYCYCSILSSTNTFRSMKYEKEFGSYYNCVLNCSAECDRNHGEDNWQILMKRDWNWKKAKS